MSHYGFPVTHSPSSSRNSRGSDGGNVGSDSASKNSRNQHYQQPPIVEDRLEDNLSIGSRGERDESAHSYQMDDDEYHQRFAEYAANHASGAHLGFDESHGSFLESTDRNDPGYLFGILQDALPKIAGSELTVELQQQRRDQTELVWERVRRWLWANPHPIQRQAAADIRGVGDATCLHLVCKLHNPPEDIVLALVDAASDAAQWTDNHGWLPLHHACANGATPEVFKILIDTFPDSRIAQDQQGRTPLHFFVTRTQDNSINMSVNAELLSECGSEGAAALPDRSGMLPFHYACAYGTHPVVLQAIARAYPACLTAKDNNGRTPMHLAMVNARSDHSSNVMRFLLDQPESAETIDTRDHDGYLPLHLLALTLKQSKKIEDGKVANLSECLSMYLAAEPFAAADFLTAIQDLPDELQDTAVVSKHVRNILNDKIIKRFPTCILMLDGIFIIVLICCFAATTRNHIDLLFDPDNNENTSQGALVMVFVSSTYFLFRELVQVASLMSLGSIDSWWKDPANYLDISVIVLTMFYGFLMSDSSGNILSNSAFRAGAAFTQGILWVAIIVYLKSTLVDFAVFVGGVFYVVQRLVAFLIAVGVILLAFAQMFYFVYLSTSMCEPNQSGDPDFDDCSFPHCTFEGSLLKVYSMMMGEIGEETRYSTNFTAQILYVGYGFLVVILLSNVLIAIVTDSYEIIQNDRAAIVFWSNRLDFVAEMDVIIYAIQRRVLGKAFDRDAGKRKLKLSVSMQESSTLEEPEQNPVSTLPPQMKTEETTIDQDGFDFEESNEFFRETWHQVMLLFDSNLYEDIDWVETWVYNIFRIFSIFVVIPLWIALGAATAGWLWPPQIREWLFVQKETTISRAELERQKLGQLKSIQSDLKSLKQEIMREIADDREEMSRMKAEVETVQGEVFADLLQVKELMDSLLSV